MNPGSVFFDKEFHFHDGESGEKLFVVLGSNKQTCLAAKTTSQPYGKGIDFGCQPNDRFHNFFLPRHSCYLKKSTWVCLDEFYELRYGDLLQKRFSGVVNPVCELPPPIVRDIQDCAVLSMDIAPVQERLVQACLVELAPEPDPEATPI